MPTMRKGFTLIELLIVIAIIGLLATLAIVSLTTAQQKARDTKRIADLKQLQNAVELFFSESDNGEYPDAAGATWTTFSADIDDYISVVPVAPNNGATDRYIYASGDDLDEYVIRATLEDETHDALDGDDDTDYDAVDTGWAAIDPVASGGTEPAVGDSVTCATDDPDGEYCLSE